MTDPRYKDYRASVVRFDSATAGSVILHQVIWTVLLLVSFPMLKAAVMTPMHDWVFWHWFVVVVLLLKFIPCQVPYVALRRQMTDAEVVEMVKDVDALVRLCADEKGGKE